MQNLAQKISGVTEQSHFMRWVIFLSRTLYMYS